MFIFTTYFNSNKEIVYNFKFIKLSSAINSIALFILFHQLLVGLQLKVCRYTYSMRVVYTISKIKLKQALPWLRKPSYCLFYRISLKFSK